MSDPRVIRKPRRRRQASVMSPRARAILDRTNAARAAIDASIAGVDMSDLNHLPIVDPPLGVASWGGSVKVPEGEILPGFGEGNRRKPKPRKVKPVRTVAAQTTLPTPEFRARMAAPAAPPKANPRQGTRRVQTCKACGESGHNRRKCMALPRLDAHDTVAA